MIVVTSTAKNAVGLAGKCVASVQSQRLPHGQIVRHLFVAADEATALDARAAINGGVLCDVSVNPQPIMYNQIELWSQLAPSDIIVHLDGDDELTPGALARVAHFYQRQDVWLTYGSFVRQDGVLDHTWGPQFGRRYAGSPPRRSPWRATHLRTFRAGLIQRVPLNHMIDSRTGKLVDACGDLATMWPMLELAGENYLVSTDVNYVYHFEHSGAKLDAEHTRRENQIVGADLASRTPLEPLRERPW